MVDVNTLGTITNPNLEYDICSNVGNFNYYKSASPEQLVFFGSNYASTYCDYSRGATSVQLENTSFTNMDGEVLEWKETTTISEAAEVGFNL